LKDAATKGKKRSLTAESIHITNTDRHTAAVLVPVGGPI
jgi:hypothetical protein